MNILQFTKLGKLTYNMQDQKVVPSFPFHVACEYANLFPGFHWFPVVFEITVESKK